MSDPDLQRPVVLVVEDEALLRMYASDTLQDAGYRVVEATDAASAIKVLESQPDIRVLFTDVQMAGQFDGLELAEKVHQRWPHVLLLVTSANCRLKDSDIPDDGRFMAKPYNAGEVISEVDDLFKKPHRINREMK